MGQDLKHPNIQLHDAAVHTTGKKHNLSITKEYILKGYSDVINGTGTLPGDNYHIKLKKVYKPVQHPPRSVPIEIKPVYKEELQWVYSEVLSHECMNAMNEQIIPVSRQMAA